MVLRYGCRRRCSVAILACWLVSSAAGQQCGNYTFQPRTAEWCSGYVSSSIYNPYPSYQIFVDILAAPELKNITDAYPLFPPACLESVLQLLCGSLFAKCGYVSIQKPDASDPSSLVTETIPVPIYPCKELCRKTNDVCEDFYELLGIKPFNCSELSLTGGKNEQWPEEGSPFPISADVSVPAVCTMGILNPDQALGLPPRPKCPYPFVDAKSASPLDMACYWPCPDGFYSPSDWQTLVYLYLVSSIMSIVAVVFLVFSYVLTPHKWKFPSRLLVYAFFSAGMMGLALIITGTRPTGRTPDGGFAVGVGGSAWCSTPVKWATQANSGTCGAQGFLFMFFSLSLIYWWMCITFNLFLTIVLAKRQNPRLEKFFHVIAWGVPFTLSTVAVAKGFMRANAPIGFCFVSGGKIGGISATYLLFYIPLMAALLVSMILLVCVFVKVSNRYRLTTNEGKNFWNTHTRIFLFILLIVYVTLLLSVWRLTTEVADFTPQVTKWVACKVRQSLEMVPDPKGVTCDQPYPTIRPSLEGTQLQAVTAGGIGVVLFLIFGTDAELYLVWRSLFRAIRSRDKPAIVQLVRHGWSGGTRTGSTGSGGSSSYRRTQSSTASIKATELDIVKT